VSAGASAPAESRRAARWAGWLFALLVVALYADPLFVRRSFAARDLSAYNLPMEKSVHDAWARGALPVWTPEVSGGRPLLPNPNAGALYPMRILLSRAAFPLAFRIYPVVHWIAAGVGMILLCRTIGRSAAAAWVAAVSYAFSGVAVAEVFFPHIQPGMTLLPWILWAVARPAPSRLSRFAVLAALFALVLLAADVFTITLAIVCAAGWIALEEDPHAQLRAAGGMAAALGVAALAAAPQIVATLLWIPQTNRAVIGMKLSDVFLYSIHPWRLLELVIPYAFGPGWHLSMSDMWAFSLFHHRPMGLFATLYQGAFAAIACAVAWRSRERGARFSRVLLVGALATAMLPSFIPESWQSRTSPLPLRNPEKFAVAVVLALALLSAIAFDSWRGRPRRLGWLIGIGALMTALAAAASLDPAGAARLAIRLTGGTQDFVRPASLQIPAALAEGALLWMATVIALDALGWSDRRRGLAVALALLTAVPILANRKIAKSFPEDQVFAPTAFARFLQRNDPEGAYRTLDETLFHPESKLAETQYEGAISDIEYSRRNWSDQTPVLFGRGTVFNKDFDAGDLSRIESLRKISGQASGFRDSDAFFGTVALKWGIRFRDQEPLAGYSPVRGDGLQVWDAHGRAYPDIRVLEGWVEAPSPLAALESIGTLGPGEVVIESGAARRGKARPGTVRVGYRSPERLEMDVDSPDGGFLFVLRAFWPYRTVLLDGKPVETLAAQLAFCAVPIPPGAHHIRWKEEVPGWTVSRYGPLLFGLVVAGAAAADWRRRKS